MAGGFGDLELLMDHNMKMTSPGFKGASPSQSTVEGKQQQQVATLSRIHEGAQHQHPLSPFASLSIAIASAPLSLFRGYNVGISKPRLSDPPSSSSASALLTAKLPSQKKCISPAPVMPAISASTFTDVSLSSASLSVSGKTKKFSSAFPDYHRLPDMNNGFGNPSGAGALRKASIVWFRSDLRCHDNEALASAAKDSLSVLPVYVFDTREYGKSSSGFDKTGFHRTKFILQCVSGLRDKLKELGSDLIIRIGKPEEVLVSLAKAIGADALYAHKEVSQGEMQLEKKVVASLQEEGVETKLFWGNTLFHVDDLPFKLEDMPTTYSAFREKVESLQIRQAIETPNQMKGLPVRGSVKPGDMPTLEELGVRAVSSQAKVGSQAAAPLIGGEKEALHRLEILTKDHLKQLSNKSNPSDNLYGSNFSSKISPWLALGCLSPRRLLEEFKTKDINGVSSTIKSSASASENGPNWLVFELLWRDFFRFITSKHASSRLCSNSVEATNASVAMPA